MLLLMLNLKCRHSDILFMFLVLYSYCACNMLRFSYLHTVHDDVSLPRISSGHNSRIDCRTAFNLFCTAQLPIKCRFVYFVENNSVVHSVRPAIYHFSVDYLMLFCCQYELMRYYLFPLKLFCI